MDLIPLTRRVSQSENGVRRPGRLFFALRSEPVHLPERFLFILEGDSQMKRTIIAATALTLTFPAFAQTAPTDLVETLSDQTMTYLDDQTLTDAEIDRLLTDVDVDGIARFALGKYFKRVEASDYEAYEDAFRTYLRGQMRDHLSRFAGGEMTVEDENQRGNQVIVETKVTRADGETLDVNWRLRNSDKGWEVIDVEAMNVWLAIEQRAQFQTELDKSGGDLSALTATLRATS